MTTNQARAAQIINAAHIESARDLKFPNPSALSQAIADEGLLSPDLPTHDRDGRWWPTASRLGSVSIRDRRIYIHSGALERMGISFTPDDADDLAGILKAAAAAARTHQEKK